MLGMEAAGFSRALAHIFQSKDVKILKNKLQHGLFSWKI
jgi:hypothetical protein